MLKIRLQRVGRKNDASFRLVVIESTKAPQAGNYLEMLGSYNPKNDMKAVKADRVKHWISVGAQVSDSAHNLLVGEGIIDGKKINVLPKKSPIIDEKALAEEAAKKKEAEEKKAEEKASAEKKKEASAEEKEEATDEKGEINPSTDKVEKEESAEDKKAETPATEAKSVEKK